MRRADARNSAGRNLTALGNKAHKKLRILIIDVVDLIDTKPADFLTTEVLFLSCGERFVATGGTLRSRNRAATASGFLACD